MRRFLFVPLALAACGQTSDTAAPTGMSAQEEVAAVPATPTDRDPAVREALSKAIAERDGEAPDLSKVLVGYTDLSGDGAEEALVWLLSPMYCGTGGCPLFVLQPEGGSWTVSDTLSVTQLPIYRLAPGADGWAELGVSVAGGGIEAAVMAVPHGPDGYADNPTVEPARPVEPGDAPMIIADLPRP